MNATIKTTYYAQVTLRYKGEARGAKVVLRFKRLKGRFLVSVYEGVPFRLYSRKEFQTIEEARQYWREFIKFAGQCGWRKVDR